jgi:uncharacterized protein YbjT (DUF2867 family)
MFSQGYSFTVNQKIRTVLSSALSAQKDSSSSNYSSVDLPSRRGFIEIAGTSIAAATIALKPSPVIASEYSGKVLVLGGTGFVGKEVCQKLTALGVDYIATSRDGRDGTIAVDFTDSSIDIASKVKDIAKGCTAVISCVGVIGTSEDVKVANKGTGFASNGAKAAGVKNFVYISVAPEVKESVKGVSAFNNYMEGKAFSEDAIKANFGNGYTIIAPTFIYGGDKFGINPPRVADSYGRLVEGLLSSGPLRAAASISPGFIGVALEPPIKVSSVAGAAVAGALGLSQHVLDTYDEINAAAAIL